MHSSTGMGGPATTSAAALKPSDCVACRTAPEFMADYEAAMAGQPLPVGAQRARPGTMTALALSYFASPEFRALKQSTHARPPMAR